MSLDLNKLENKLDEALNNETSETLSKFLNDKRMTNNKQQTAVDSIIEFCQKQMENDSSIHKGVYLSIIKFCKEQITEESEIHWKTTLVTMTNNKQQTAVEWFANESWQLKVQLENEEISVDEYAVAYVRLLYKAKEMEKEKMIEFSEQVFRNRYNEVYQSLTKVATDTYNETYGGGEQ